MIDLLIEGDHIKCRQYWAEMVPDFPQPQSDEEAEIVMHQARTSSDIPMDLRLWSHRWLTERNIPSLLPGVLYPVAEQLEIIEAKSIGIAVVSFGKRGQEEADTIRKQLEIRAADIMSGKIPPSEDIRKALDEIYATSGET